MVIDKIMEEEYETGIRIFRPSRLSLGQLAKILDFIPAIPNSAKIHLSGNLDYLDLLRVMGLLVSGEIRADSNLEFTLNSPSKEVTLSVYKGFCNFESLIRDPTNRRRHSERYKELFDNISSEFFVKWDLGTHQEPVKVHLEQYQLLAGYPENRKPGYITKVQEAFKVIN